MRNLLCGSPRQVHEATGHRGTTHVNPNAQRSQDTFLGRVFDAGIRQSWWVIGFALACFALYESGAHILRKEEQSLFALRESLLQQQVEASQMQAVLKRQIASQNDPASIEMSLIRVLGLVHENYEKIRLPRPTDREETQL